MTDENKANIAAKIVRFIKILLYLSVLIPLVIGAYSFSFSDYPQVFLVRTISSIGFILYLIVIWLDKTYWPKINLKFLIPLAVWIVVMAASTLNSFNVHRSFWGSLEHVFGLITYGGYFAYFWLVISLFKKERDWIWWLRGAAIVGLVGSLVAFGQRLGWWVVYNVDVGRVSGTLSNPDYYSFYLVLAIGVTALLVCMEKQRWIKYGLVGVILLDLIALILTYSRGSWVGLLFGILVFAVLKIYYWLKKKSVRSRQRILSYILVGTVALFLINFGIVNSSLLQNRIVGRFYSIFHLSQAMSTRTGAWATSWQAFRERPILGWGLLSSGYTFDHFVDSSFFKVVSTNLVYYHPHNFILEIMADMGIVGLIAYLWWFCTIIYLLIKNSSETKNLILVSILAANFLQSLNLFDTPSGYLMQMFILAFVYYTVSKRPADEPAKLLAAKRYLKLVPRSMALAGTIILIMFISVIWYRANLQAIWATHYFVEGVKLERNDFMKAFALYQKGTVQNTVYDKHLRYGLISRSLTAMDNGNKSLVKKPVLDQLDKYKLSLTKECDTPDISPVTPYDLLAKIYEQDYFYSRDPQDLQPIIRVAEAGLAKFKARPHFYYLLGRAKIYANEKEEGEKYLYQAVTSGPESYLTKQVNYYKSIALTYYQQSDVETAIPYFLKSVDMMVLQRKANQLGSAPVSPQNLDVQYFQNLVALLYRRGQYEETRQLLAKAQYVFPELSEVWDKLKQEVEEKSKIKD